RLLRGAGRPCRRPRRGSPRARRCRASGPASRRAAGTRGSDRRRGPPGAASPVRRSAGSAGPSARRRRGRPGSDRRADRSRGSRASHPSSGSAARRPRAPAPRPRHAPRSSPSPSPSPGTARSAGGGAARAPRAASRPASAARRCTAHRSPGRCPPGSSPSPSPCPAPPRAPRRSAPWAPAPPHRAAAPGGCASDSLRPCSSPPPQAIVFPGGGQHMHRQLCAARLGLAVLLGLAIVTSFASVAPAAAQTGDPLISDRPDFTESTGTIAPGRFQIEGGITSQEIGEEDSLSVGELLVRYGLGENLEARLGVGSWTRIEVPGDQLEGFEDPTVQMKVRLTPPVSDRPPGFPAVALLVGTSVPVGSEELTADEWEPEAVLAFDWILTDMLTLGANLGVAFPTADGEQF